MDALDAKIAKALDGIKNQGPTPQRKKSSNKKQSSSAKIEEAVKTIGVTNVIETEKESTTPQLTEEVVTVEATVTTTETEIATEAKTESCNSPTKKGVSSSSKTSSPLPSPEKRTRVLSQDPIERVRRPSLIDDLDTETVNFSSTYHARHISPMGNNKTNSRTSSFDHSNTNINWKSLFGFLVI